MRKIFTFTGPSASGKTMLVNTLTQGSIPMRKLVSNTTRSPRTGEIQGKDYHFVTKSEFDKLELLESACYAESYYGLSVREVNYALSLPEIPLAIIELQGLLALKKIYRENIVSIFISVDPEIVTERMIKRGDNPEEIIKRVKNISAFNEVENGKYCDYIIKNNLSFQTTLSEAQKIILENC